jgi:hypothetical protein
MDDSVVCMSQFCDSVSNYPPPLIIIITVIYPLIIIFLKKGQIPGRGETPGVKMYSPGQLSDGKCPTRGIKHFFSILFKNRVMHSTNCVILVGLNRLT